MTRMPTWKRFEPHSSCAAAEQLAGAGAPSVLLAVEAKQAAEQEHRQAEIGIPAEEGVVEPVLPCSLSSGCCACATARRDALARIARIVRRSGPSRPSQLAASPGPKGTAALLPGGIERGEVTVVGVLFGDVATVARVRCRRESAARRRPPCSRCLRAASRSVSARRMCSGLGQHVACLGERAASTGIQGTAAGNPAARWRSYRARAPR